VICKICITISNAAYVPLHIFTLNIYHIVDGYADHGGASMSLQSSYWMQTSYSCLFYWVK